MRAVQDFLVHDHYELEAFAERDYLQEKLKQGITQMVSKIESMRRPWYNGLELLEDAQLNNGTLSTGCERIDVLLQGGLREGHVTELVGPSSSGKTQVNEAVQQVMRSIVCHSVFDIFTLLDMLQQLMNNLKSQIGCQVRMLIVDSLSSLIAPILGGGGTHGHALMLTAGFLLKELAHEHNLSVLVTNHMVAGEFGISKPALGESWKSIPHVRLMLSRGYATNANVSCISILKHPYLASGKTSEFTIVVRNATTRSLVLDLTEMSFVCTSRKHEILGAH
ncbi:DNA repair protein rad51 homolog 4 [Phtheirospermum japonicum]|uniref:DNA repair protein rad51 homolog 4 n=1 Tax=Phtheirospermum japonicum TaxID=374723 RepID=A0A830CKQ0_9LAMI|nr:DNA repair protein rad51 homolog 4 [Phtheirospermum japonicum]